MTKIKLELEEEDLKYIYFSLFEEGHRYQNSKADMIRSNLVVALERTEAGKEFLKKL